MTITPREVRQLAHAAAGADDEAIRRIVAFVDAMPQRGVLDTILEPVRRRLRGLDQPRPLRLARLLFLPMDGAIVPAPAWERGAAQLPRSAIPALAEAVQDSLGEEAGPLAEAMAGRTTRDRAIVGRVGGRLWALAAERLPDAPPPGWAEATGLTGRDYAELAGLCRPVWAAAPAIWPALDAAQDGPPEALTRTALLAIAPAGPGPIAAVLATLMLRAAAPGRVADIAAGVAPQAREQVRGVLDAVMAAPLPAFIDLSDEVAAEAGHAMADKLEDLERCAMLDARRKQRLAALRSLTEETYRHAFVAAAESQLVRPLNVLAGVAEASDAEVEGMEATARLLRAREAAGRRLGRPEAYDQAVRRLADSIGTLAGGRPPEAAIQLIDIVRIVEIMAGSEAAAAVLRRG